MFGYGGTVPNDSQELRLVLLGSIDCGKTSSGDTLLSETTLPSSSHSSRRSQERHGLAEGRQLTLVEMPRWIWSGQQVEESVGIEMQRALLSCAPGPHVFLFLIPVRQFMDMERLIPSEMERILGEGALRHTMLLFTCGDYLMGGSVEDYLATENPGLQEVLEKCGGRYHVINNRKPREREQVRALLKKVDELVKENGGCFIQRDKHPKPMEGDTDRVDAWQTPEPPSKGLQAKEDCFTEERVSVKQVGNGLHSQLPIHQTAQPSSPVVVERSSAFRLSTEGALLYQPSETKTNESFVNSIFHRVSISSENPGPTLAECPSLLPELRLVLLGHRRVERQTVGNCILGRDAFAAGSAEDQICEKHTAVVAGRQVTVLDTPDCLCSELPIEDIQHHLSACKTLCSPGAHAFLLCIPVDRPADGELRTLASLVGYFGPSAMKAHTLVLFTHSTPIGEVEEYIATQRPELLQLVERCGDRYHVLETVRGTGLGQKAVADLLEKVEETVKEGGVDVYTFTPQPERAPSQFLKERRGGGEEELKKSLPPPSLYAVQEEDEVDMDMSARSVDTSPSTASPSLLQSTLEKVVARLQRIPKLAASGALLGGLAGLFLAGTPGGAVGAIAGLAVTEVGRRKYSSKSKTQ